jgi:hypothetical protein
MSWNTGTQVPLMLYRAVHAVWALALLGFVAPIIAAHGLTWLGLLYLIAFAAYGVAAVGLFADRRWAWTISIAFLAGYWILRGWMAWADFVANIYMFLSGHELYQDSPATSSVPWWPLRNTLDRSRAWKGSGTVISL